MRLHPGLLAAAALVLQAPLQPLYSQPLPAHVGSQNPVGEGFTPNTFASSSATAAVANDLGLPAWSIVGSARDSQFAYLAPFSAQQHTDVINRGFRLTYTARAELNLSPVYDSTNHTAIVGAQVGVGGRRYDADLGINVNGDTVVVLASGIDNSGPGNSVRTPGASYTLVGSGSTYHTYQLDVNATTHLADLSVDGVVRLQDYAGHTDFVYDGYAWSAYSGGRAYYNEVSGVVPVPEPAGLLLAAGVLLVARRTCRRRRRA